MYELTRTLNSQTESTTIFFEEADANKALAEAQKAGDAEEPKLRKLTIEQYVAEAREAGYDDFGIFEKLFHETDGYDEIENKAFLYDKMIADRRKGAAKANNISAEARRERAKKAAAKRWSK